VNQLDQVLSIRWHLLDQGTFDNSLTQNHILPSFEGLITNSRTIGNSRLIAAVASFQRAHSTMEHVLFQCFISMFVHAISFS